MQSCDEGFELSANTCVASPGTIAYVCPNGTIAAGVADATDTEKCSACNAGFELNEANACVVSVYQHPLASALVPAGPFSLATSAKVSHSATLALGDAFGSAVAFAGNLDDDGGTVLAVGALGDDTGGLSRGAIYLLSYSVAGALQTTKKIASGLDETNAGSNALAPTLANAEGFGTSIANAGDLYGNSTTVLAVGASNADTTGAIYLLSFNASGSLTATTKITSATDNGPALANSDQFGSSIANAGNLDGNGGTVLAVGAVRDNTGGSNRGAIYLLSFSTAGALQNTKKIASGLDETNVDSNSNAPSLRNSDSFGSSIANAGDFDGGGGIVLAVGANNDGTSSRGAIHLLSFNATGSLTATSTKIADGTTHGPVLTDTYLFGTSLASAGNLDGRGGRVLAVGGTGSTVKTNKTGELQLLYFTPPAED